MHVIWTSSSIPVSAPCQVTVESTCSHLRLYILGCKNVDRLMSYQVFFLGVDFEEDQLPFDLTHILDTDLIAGFSASHEHPISFPKHDLLASSCDLHERR